MVELSDWNCCGGASAATLSEDAQEALGRRNLERVRNVAPELLCPCPHCYTSFARTLAAAGEAGAESPVVRLRSILDVFASEEVLARLLSRRVEPLTDLPMVGYYGCKLLRPDPEAIRLGSTPSPDDGGSGGGPIERVIEACGAKPVEWSAGGDCCGSALGVARVEVAEELLGRIYQAALDAGAEAIVTVCPLCHLNLDLHQYQVSQRLGRSVDIPVFFLTELMAVALGVEESEDWLERHVTSPLPMFMRFIEAEEERQYWGPGGPPGESVDEKAPPAGPTAEEVGTGAPQGDQHSRP